MAHRFYRTELFLITPKYNSTPTLNVQLYSQNKTGYISPYPQHITLGHPKPFKFINRFFTVEKQ